MALDDVLRICLREAGVRPVDLGRELGISPQMATMLLRGKRGFSKKHYHAVARLIKTDPKNLLDLGWQRAMLQRGNTGAAGVVLSSGSQKSIASLPEVPRARDTAFSSDQFATAIRELTISVAAVETISGELHKLHARLAARLESVIVAYGTLTGGQAPMARPDAPSRDARLRERDRHPHGKGGHTRKTG